MKPKLHSRRIEATAAGFFLALVGCANGESSDAATPPGPDAMAAGGDASVGSPDAGAGAADTTAASDASNADVAILRAEAGGERIRVLVTNDDGVHAAGIDTLVKALLTVPGVELTIVAPRNNQSGTGGSTTPGGNLKVGDAVTASGFPAKAVSGYPADCIIWAIDQHGVPDRPDVVFSGINEGANVGAAVPRSGTIGAARAAAARGIPALASSQGVGANQYDYDSGATQAMAWFEAHRADIMAGKAQSPILLENLNIPTCTKGAVRGVVTVPISNAGGGFGNGDCTSTRTNPVDDVQALSFGFAALSTLPLQ